jgi:DNA mismatch repair protein MutS
MSFADCTVSPSILFDADSDRIAALDAAEPDFFIDLNIDQIVEAVTANWTEYDLRPLFLYPLARADAVGYRHEVFRDLEGATLFASVQSFAQHMRDVRSHVALAGKLHERFHKEGWFLHAAEVYCDAVRQFASQLAVAPLQSSGLLAFRDYLTSYAGSAGFTALSQQTTQLAIDLSSVTYNVLIRDTSFTVCNYESEADYSAEIDDTFRKFQQGAVKDYKVKYRDVPQEMNSIEGKILEFVAQLNPDLFSRLVDFCAQHADFIDATIARFDREVHFYVAYLVHIAKLRRTGLNFCYPLVSPSSKAVHACDAFDLALAQKLLAEQAAVVCNDFCLRGTERIIVVTGPNQGGKTTFARMFGQLHFLASLGCLVPGRDAQLFLSDRLFTHFEREEKVENLRGKLEDDLVRVHAILQRATPRSIIMMNEAFTSTTVQDELFLSRRVIERLDELDALCVWVTFLDELASFNEKTVSMVSTIVPDNPAMRTFKVVRRPADGLAYAMAIAEKYRLAYGRIVERVRS